jgi:hypothetical protein
VGGASPGCSPQPGAAAGRGNRSRPARRDGAIPVTVRMGEGAVTGARSTLEPIVEKGRERASARRFGSGSGLWPRASARHLDLPAKLGRAAEPIRFRRRLSADRRQCAARC